MCLQIFSTAILTTYMYTHMNMFGSAFYSPIDGLHSLTPSLWPDCFGPPCNVLQHQFSRMAGCVLYNHLWCVLSHSRIIDVEEHHTRRCQVVWSNFKSSQTSLHSDQLRLPWAHDYCQSVIIYYFAVNRFGRGCNLLKIACIDGKNGDIHSHDNTLYPF